MFLLILVLLILTWYFWRNYSPYFSLPGCYWFIYFKMFLTFLRGNIPGIKSFDMFVFYKVLEIAGKHKAEGVFFTWFPIPALIIYSPEAIKFFSNEPTLAEKPATYKLLDTFLKNGPFSVDSKKIKEKKKFIGPAFYPSMIKNFMITMTEHAECLVHELKQLENGTTDDLYEIIKTKMLNLFLESALGLQSDSREYNDKIDQFIKLTTSFSGYFNHRLVRPWLHMDFMLHFFPSGREHLKMAKELDFIAMQILEDIKKSYSLRTQVMNFNDTDAGFHETSNMTFGDVLIEQHLKNPSYKLEDVKADLKTFMFAGYDIVSTTLTWCLWLLGLHQDVQEKAYREIKTATDEVIQFEDIRNLIYLENVTKETLRLYPIPVYARLSEKDLHFGKYTIPRGTCIAFYAYGLHHNPDVYLEPESFNPDRFGEKHSNVKPWTFVPFAEGVRSCLGKKYAMLAMKIFLLQILRNFKLLSLTSKEDVEYCWELFLKSKTPISVKFIPRH